MNLSLDQIVSDFATSMFAVDRRGPVFVTRTGRAYQPGIGPHSEEKAVEPVLLEMRSTFPDRYANCGQGLIYPGSRQKCDLWIGDPLDWVVAVNATQIRRGDFYHQKHKTKRHPQRIPESAASGNSGRLRPTYLRTLSAVVPPAESKYARHFDAEENRKLRFGRRYCRATHLKPQSYSTPPNLTASLGYAGASPQHGR